MRRALLAAALLAAAGASASAQDADAPQITVTGEAMIGAAPDLAVIDAGVSTEAKSAREASDANNAAMGKVLLALKGTGIAEKDLQTQRLALQPQYSNRNGPNSIASYRASNRVAIRLRDMAQVATMIDLVVAAGANEIGGVNFTVAQPSKLLDDARAQAIADARRKADIYAKAAGVELGAPLAIAEQNGFTLPLARRAGASFAAQPMAAPIAQGEETLRVTVVVSWAIKGAKAQ